MDNLSATANTYSSRLSDSNPSPFTRDNMSTTTDAQSGWISGPLPGLFWQIMYSIIAIVGIIGNTLVVFVFSRVQSLRNLTSLFLVSLAVADFITSVVLIPLHLGKTILSMLLFKGVCFFSLWKINFS